MGNTVVSEVVPRKNRLLVCPECGGTFANDKDAFTSEQGFIYRERQCLNCLTTFYTKQGPEEITSVIKPVY